MTRFIARSLGIVLAAALTACGGGGDDATTESTASVLRVPRVAVTSVTPAIVLPGQTFVVAGSGLGAVSAVLLGPTNAQFTHVRGTLVVKVPLDVQSTSLRITLQGNGFSVQPATAVTVAMPMATALSSNVVAPGGEVVVTGQMLDRVRSFLVGTTTLQAREVSAGSATLEIPQTPFAGTLSLVDATGQVRNSGLQLTVQAPLLVTSVSRAAAVAGDTVTVYGSGLDAVTSVAFDNGAAASITAQSASSLSFVVPAVAVGSGTSLVKYASAITLASATERIKSAAVLSIGAALSVDKTTAVQSTGETRITISGFNLGSVLTASVGGVPAVVVSVGDTAVVLSAPVGATGAVLLTTPYQSSVAAGALAASRAHVTTLSELDFAQVLNRSATDASLRLTPQRPVLVRAFVTSDVAGVANPGVSLVVSNGTTPVGTLAMTGPATLPTATSVNSLTSTFNVTVPAAWVKPGVAFKAVVAAGGGVAASVVSAAPAVGTATQLKLVLVPLSINGRVGVPPDVAAVRRAFARVYPMASGDIEVSVRQAFTVTGVPAVRTNDDLNVALSQLESLRDQESPQAFYYGFFSSAAANPALGGVGYVGTKGYEKDSAASAVGMDAAYQFNAVDPLGVHLPAWARVMLHEVGHNHSLLHAPCGAPSMPDAQYPYAGGTLNPLMPVYESEYADDTSIGTLSSSTPGQGAMTDLMGYCDGIYFSDYSYNKLQSFAEQRTAAVASAAAPAALAAAATSPGVANVRGFVVVSGSITKDGEATLNPAQAVAEYSRQGFAGTTSYALRVTTESGQVLTYPVLAQEVADSTDGTLHFTRVIPNPGQAQAVEVVQGTWSGRGRRGREHALATRLHEATDVHQTRAARWAESGGQVTVEWNADAEPFASVTHVGADGKRSVLALRLQGGAATVSTEGLPPGGRLELSFSSSSSARLVSAQR